MNLEISPILIEVIKNRLGNIMEESLEVIRRTARSVNINEIVDCSSVLWNEEYNIIGQATAIPVHILSMQYILEKVIEIFPPESLSPGDVVCTNDPYLGDAQHLPDIAMITPIFYINKIVGYAGSMAHYQDIGGSCAGGMTNDTEDIYQEGLRIPPIRILKKNKVQKDIMEVIFANTRVKKELFEGDVKAQIAGNNIAKKRYIELLDKYGVITVKVHENAILEYSKNMMKREIKAIPDGNYEFTDYIESGIGDHRLHVTVKVKGDKIICDYNGSDKQIKLPFNCMFGCTRAMSVYTVCCLLDSNLPKNGGAFSQILITAPKGSILYPIEPSPCSNRNLAGHRIPDIILGALAKIIPQKVIAACYGSTSSYNIMTKKANENNALSFVSSVGPGGMGASINSDGQDAVCCHLSNTLAFEMEATEVEAPLKILNYSIRNDSGGAGKYRGGCGLNIQIQFLADESKLALVGGRHRNSPYGLFGGKGGMPARYRIKKAIGNVEKVNANCYLTMGKNDVLIYESAGGGGYGNPLDRDIKLVLRDIENGFVSVEKAKEDYGIIASVDFGVCNLIGITKEREMRKSISNEK